MMKQSPVFIKHYDLMAWLIPCTLNFPKSQRGVLARQLQTELFRIQTALVQASASQDPRPGLEDADQALICLRTYLRLSRDLKLMSSGQYQHVSKLVAEVGRLLGGWTKRVNAVPVA